MSNIWNIIKNIVSELTSVFDWSTWIGCCRRLAYGEPVLGLDVVGGITSLVSDLASMGVVGLLVLAILMALLSKHVD